MKIVKNHLRTAAASRGLVIAIDYAATEAAAPPSIYTNGLQYEQQQKLLALTTAINTVSSGASPTTTSHHNN